MSFLNNRVRLYTDLISIVPPTENISSSKYGCHYNAKVAGMFRHEICRQEAIYEGSYITANVLEQLASENTAMGG